MCRNPSRRKARPTSRTPSKAQRSGFARKKEEGASIVQFSPQGGNGMVRTSSDASGVYALVNRGYLLTDYIRPGEAASSRYCAKYLQKTAPGRLQRKRVDKLLRRQREGAGEFRVLRRDRHAHGAARGKRRDVQPVAAAVEADAVGIVSAHVQHRLA